MDHGDFYATAATLTPVLLLTIVVSQRRGLERLSLRWRIGTVVFVMLPAAMIEAFAMTGLAIGGSVLVWPTLVLLVVLLGGAMGSFALALLRPQDHDVS